MTIQMHHKDQDEKEKKGKEATENVKFSGT
jgi:hypothetical protein